MMTQNIDEQLWEELERESQRSKRELEAKAVVQNSKPLDDNSWTAKIVSKVRISELAFDNGINDCPKCHYSISFDDSRGWFICANQKYNKKKCFSGNIVDFQSFILGGRK